MDSLNKILEQIYGGLRSRKLSKELSKELSKIDFQSQSWDESFCELVSVVVGTIYGKTVGMIEEKDCQKFLQDIKKTGEGRVGVPISKFLPNTPVGAFVDCCRMDTKSLEGGQGNEELDGGLEAFLASVEDCTNQNLPSKLEK